MLERRTLDHKLRKIIYSTYTHSEEIQGVQYLMADSCILLHLRHHLEIHC